MYTLRHESITFLSLPLLSVIMRGGYCSWKMRYEGEDSMIETGAAK